jgi:formylglycine-generating enzyme required for sulfatase activity
MTPDAALTPDAAPVQLAVTAAPAALVFHVNDTRTVEVTVTNTGTVVTDGPAVVQFTGLSSASAALETSACTAALVPGASCAARYTLTATTATGGTADEFAVEVTAAPGGTASAALTATVFAACPAVCGVNANANCCASTVVPGNAEGATLEGEVFYRGYDAATDDYNDMGYPATVSDFRLDVYEVTVGRFRAFVEAGYGTQAQPPAAGSGAHAAIPGSGWDSGWNGSLAATTAALKAALKCDAMFQTWTDTAGANEFRPINCVTWYEAMAFCAWDGGYLPTEAEWNYAAAGGSEQRAYPWSVPASSTTISEANASYYVDSTQACRGDGVDGCTVADFIRPGSKPAGNGRWGQADLGGNVWEATLDWYAVPYANPCNNCADLASYPQVVIRGGSLARPVSELRGAYRLANLASARGGGLGLRCARTP